LRIHALLYKLQILGGDLGRNNDLMGSLLVSRPR
jgi:hypothetical protein